jgi:hypothetical protein
VIVVEEQCRVEVVEEGVEVIVEDTVWVFRSVEVWYMKAIGKKCK